MSLPQLLKERLLNRESLDIAIKKANEYRVRKYVKDYFEDLKEILWILDILPEKQIKKLFEDEDAYLLMDITERALVYLDFMPLRKTDEGDLIAEKTLSIRSNNREYNNPSIKREATDQDIQRYTTLKQHVVRLFTFITPSPHVIYNKLDVIYFKDLIKKAKKDGYKPAEAREIKRTLYIPKLTEGQKRFRKTQQNFDEYGIEINSPEDLEKLREIWKANREKEEQERQALGAPSDEKLAKAIPRFI